MTEPLTHPSPAELCAFNLGQLAPEAAAVVESHIGECESCCETLLGLKSDDTFVELLQDARRNATDGTVDQNGIALESATSPTKVPAPLANHPRYEIVSLIGKGGMGDVYKAKHRVMERIVALKIIKRLLVRKPEAIDRFHREVKTAARLSHPNIVTAYDAEQAGDLHFLVMEYVDGIDLARMLHDGGKLSVRDACEYVRQAAAGLQYAHERGMVHRDIKPHNLMVSTDGTVKILDFGLASLAPQVLSGDGEAEAASYLTMAGSIMGTPDFISPEQATDAHQADIRSDIYSLGATLYCLLSGRPPFADESILSKLQHHAKSEPQPIEQLRDDIPLELASAIRYMTAKDPAARFQSPQEVAEALAPFAAEPGATSSVTNRQPVEKESKSIARSYRGNFRHGLFVTTALTGGLLALIAAAVFYIQSGKTTLRFEIHDPSVTVSFGEETINVHTAAGKSFQVAPSSEQKFTILQYGTEVETDSLTLRQGQKVALSIDVVDGALKVVSNNPQARVDRSTIAKRTDSVPSPSGLDHVVRNVRPVREMRHADSVSSLVWMPDGTIVTSAWDPASETWQLYFRDAGENGDVPGLSFPEKTGGVSHMAASADGKWLAVARREAHEVALWDAQLRKPKMTFDAGGLVHSVSISPDNKLLAAASWDGSAKVWSIETDQLVKELKGYDRAHRVLFSPDGNTLVVSDSPTGVTDLWDTTTWSKRATCRNKYAVGQMAFTPNGKLLATGGTGLRNSTPDKLAINVWNAATGKLAMRFDDMRNGVEALAVSLDSRYLISVGGNWGTDPAWGGKPHEAEPIRVWELTTQQLVAEFSGHNEWVRAIAFSPDGTRFATASNDGTVKVWDIAIVTGSLAAADSKRVHQPQDSAFFEYFSGGGSQTWYLPELETSDSDVTLQHAGMSLKGSAIKGEVAGALECYYTFQGSRSAGSNLLSALQSRLLEVAKQRGAVVIPSSEKWERDDQGKLVAFSFEYYALERSGARKDGRARIYFVDLKPLPDASDLFSGFLYFELSEQAPDPSQGINRSE
jgi:serine/threonine protein kinase